MIFSTINFCTLFNSNYLSRGLVMYDSLKKNCKNFHLYVFAFDNITCSFLKSGNYENMTVISLKEFEDEELLEVKKNRTSTEYCWTCTPSTILYCINKFSLDNCTYIDADLVFYEDPKHLIEEMGNNSVMITEHRYTKEYDLTFRSGKYCVQFVSFRNDSNSMYILNWWRKACIEWCYNRLEDGKFGDQKYLDDWTSRFKGVHELQHLGGGLAPWNIQQYNFRANDLKIIGEEKITKKNFNVIFYHFHGVKFYENNIINLVGSNYELSQDIKKLFYNQYINLLELKKREINNLDKTFDPHGTSGKASSKPLNLWKMFKFYVRQVLRNPKNIFSFNMIKLKNHIHFHYIKDFN